MRLRLSTLEAFSCSRFFCMIKHSTQIGAFHLREFPVLPRINIESYLSTPKGFLYSVCRMRGESIGGHKSTAKWALKSQRVDSVKPIIMVLFCKVKNACSGFDSLRSRRSMVLKLLSSTIVHSTDALISSVPMRGSSRIRCSSSTIQ